MTFTATRSTAFTVTVAAALGFGIAAQGRLGVALIALIAGSLAVLPILAYGARAIVPYLALAPLAFPFVRVPQGHPLVTLDRFWVGAVTVAVVLRGFPRARTRPVTRVQWALIWLTVAAGTAAALSAGFGTSSATWVDAYLLPAFVFLAVRVLIQEDRDRLLDVLRAMTIAALVAAGLGIAERIFGFELASLSGGAERYDPQIALVRVSGPFPSPEPQALFLIVGLAAARLRYRLRPPSRVTAVIVPTVIVVGIAITYFRAAWIAAAIVLIGGLIWQQRSAVRRLGVAVLLGLTVFAAFLQFEQSTTFKTRASNTSNVSGRLATYEDGFEIWKLHPVLGIGIKRYPFVQPTLPNKQVVGGVASVPNPHSTYVGTLAEQGLIGFLPLIVLTGSIAAMVARLARRSRTEGDRLLAIAAATSGVGYLVMSLTLTMIYFGSSNSMFMALMGCVAASLELQSSD